MVRFAVRCHIGRSAPFTSVAAACLTAIASPPASMARKIPPTARLSSLAGIGSSLRVDPSRVMTQVIRRSLRPSRDDRYIRAQAPSQGIRVGNGSDGIRGASLNCLRPATFRDPQCLV